MRCPSNDSNAWFFWLLIPRQNNIREDNQNWKNNAFHEFTSISRSFCVFELSELPKYLHVLNKNKSTHDVNADNDVDVDVDAGVYEKPFFNSEHKSQ